MTNQFPSPQGLAQLEVYPQKPQALQWVFAAGCLYNTLKINKLCVIARNEATATYANQRVKCHQNHTAASHSTSATASSP